MSNPLSVLSDNIEIDRSLCTGCGICVDRCILDNLRLHPAPCRSACPLGLNPQSIAQRCAQGDFDGALGEICEKTPFLGLLAQGCARRCESACALGAQPVPTGALESFLASRMAGGQSPKRPDRPPVGRAAVAGNGAAALSAAWRLFFDGFDVTLFQEGDEPWRALEGQNAAPETALAEWTKLRQAGIPVKTGEALDFPRLLELLDGYGVLVADGDTLPAVRGRQAHPVSRMDREFPGLFLAQGEGDASQALAQGLECAQSARLLLQGDDLTYGRAPQCGGPSRAEPGAGAKLAPTVAKCALPARSAGSQAGPNPAQAQSVNRPGPQCGGPSRAEPGAGAELAPAAAKCEGPGPLSEQEARLLAGRCLHCGYPEGYHRTCWLCLPCEIACPHQALKVHVHYIMA